MPQAEDPCSAVHPWWFKWLIDHFSWRRNELRIRNVRVDWETGETGDRDRLGED